LIAPAANAAQSMTSTGKRRTGPTC